MAWYIVIMPSPDAREGTPEVNPQYANVREDHWVLNRRRATYWFKKERAEAEAASIVLRKPKYVGLIEVMWFKLSGYGL